MQISKSVWNPRTKRDSEILPPFQIIGRFGFIRFIDVMHLDIYYV
jgi:hypothetical protein